MSLLWAAPSISAFAPPTQKPSAAPVAIEKYADEARGREQVFQTGYHVRLALRGWLETPPSSVFGESIGINFGNVPRPQIDAAMRHLARNGFRHVRIEVGWVALDEQGNLINEDIRAALVAAKKHRLRPLVLLNSHEGVPCPTQTTRVTLLRPVAAGDRSLYVSPEDAAKVHLFRTGFSHENGFYRAANVMVVGKWDANGTWAQTRLDLSQPLQRDIAAGPVEMTTLLSPPFFSIKRADDGSLHPVQMQALHRWIGSYVAPLLRQVDALVGKGRYDVEVGNEPMFGSAYFMAGAQYIDEAARAQLGWEWGWHLLSEITRRTADHVHANHPGVEVVYGFSSQSMWTTAGSEVTTERHSRHFYVPLLTREGITYWYPEQTASSDYDGINTMALDLLPFSYNQFGRNNHSWNRDGSEGPASVLTQTEGGSVPEYARQAGVSLSDADAYHLRAKWEIRQLLFFANKGGVNKNGRGTRYYLYTFREGDKVNYHQIAKPEFFAHLSKNGGAYPASGARERSVTAPAFTVIKRARGYLPVRPRITTPRSLSVERIEERHGNRQIEQGEHGPLFNRDVLAVLPFQTSDSSFAIPIYVQTLNLSKQYRAGSDPARFDMPAEKYRIKLGGIRWQPGVSSARLVDLMSGTSRAVTVDADGYISLDITDAPRILVLKGV